ncbi:MAG: hypothetical protein R3280_11760 [Marinobacter sp.]|uniref:hypothetical protein n=1 Tax=Marinobacter sp. TaxID=50741 RepID=UPI00299F2CE9|nr:hypothetical protein [Marinobacter sp.]MDX1635307.1 hypothetical protein [Marinobacter sp.]
MATLAPERSWLLDPNLLKLVHQCRRLIHSEFGVKLHLTEEHLAQRLATYAEQSRSSHLANTWATLKERVPALSPQAEGESPKRMYRGQPIADDDTGRPAPADGGEGPARQKKIIYRGQVVG